MARKTVYVDDLDGSDISEDAGGPVRFSLRGTLYEIDLSEKNQAKLDKALAIFIEHAAEVEDEPPAPVRTRGAGTRRAGGNQPARTDKEQLQAMREWLRAQGHDVSDRGRIAGNLQDLYHAAHK